MAEEVKEALKCFQVDKIPENGRVSGSRIGVNTICIVQLYRRG